MPGRIRELLFHPDTFFAQVTGEETDLRPQYRIVGLAGILSGLSMLVFLLVVDDMMILAVPFFVPLFLVLPFIAWGIAAVVIHFLSRALSGTGTLDMTLRTTGYGMLPWAAGHTAIMLTFIVMAWDVNYSGVPAGSSPFLNGLGMVFLALGVVFTLWTGGLWIYGTKHAQRITVKRALIPVAFPLALYVYLILFPAIFSFGWQAGIFSLQAVPP